MIAVNSVFQYIDGERIRIIYIIDKFAYLVNVDAATSMPKRELIKTIEEEILYKKLILIKDPFAKIIDENNLSKVQIYKRDKDWDFILKYWDVNKQSLLEKNTRNKTFKKISKLSGLGLTKVKKVFSRYWQRGMSKNALLPDYKNSGGKGKDKNLSKNKVGRPKKANYYGEIVQGINITDDVKIHFKIAIDKYYRNKNKMSLKETYNLMLRDFYSDSYVEDNEIKHLVWDKSKTPTYGQFYYWFKKLENPKKDILFRESSKEFELKHRAILSNSTIETNGPGTRFQIDATIADIYLVSSLNRNRIIGRPIVYAIIDVFSRLITGIYVGLEGPSWIGAMMALDNMITDKVEFCRKYNIEITEEQWPSKYLPEIIIADRGEFEGYSVENLINNLNVKIENTSPYRGDLKGIVERNFRTINTRIKHKTPGAIQKEFRERGDRDYRLDATLTLDEFTAIIIKMVLYHNNKLIDKYPMEKEMIEDEIVPIPIKLWRWGIENKKGRLRVVDQERFRLNILPKGKANVSRAGIRFKNMYYGSKKAIEEQWFIKSKVRSIEIVYDPRNMNQIYIPYEDGMNYEKCYLLEGSMQYKDCILEEIIFNEELSSELKEQEKNQQTQINIDLDKEIEKIVKKAKNEKQKAVSYDESKNKKIKGIKRNRIVEKDINRLTESFDLGEKKGDEKEKATVIELPINKQEHKSNELTGKARLMEKLRKKRDEKREK
ncbi:Mu transposase C-terminal domain-containing protein [Clostridium botulinum]|uniref:Mu transposase C-terminal domain-containing protein n=1 Tax=Clostridium botulinum TaxID=1491 RepID=UPI0006AC5609|nr:Mu transposase C-terminal domain-containing protein [Clostridium botulinum]AWB32032.1 transposase [Clostridium botulinum]KOR52455.1 transposase [Clostridium botulinum]MBY6832110.1 DDE-type integrase/transposase/recombinase [Clostridium botulinum]MBY6942495.1 DDE-type integrase/transposase/recombinase [Clostridium botulinum]MBY6963277.1 DDE-type integrase/transposase/recombinase [Clostridium botulinum]